MLPVRTIRVLFGRGFRYGFDSEKKRFVQIKEAINISAIEKSIITRASKGMSTVEIAKDLHRSVETIKTHKKRIFKKLDVVSMAEAVTYASNYGLI